MADVAQAFINGRLAGQAALQNRQRHEQDVEENNLRRMVLKHQIEGLKIQDQLKGRELDIERAKMFEGRPESEMPTLPAPTEMMPGNPQMQMAPAPFQIRGVPEMGLPADTVQPKSAETLQELAQMMARQKYQEELDKPRVLNQGDQLVAGGKMVAENPKPAPVTREKSLDQQLVDALRSGDKNEERIIRTAIAARKSGGDAAGDTALKRGRLAQTVLDNPSLWDDLTPTDKGEIAADLAKTGFQGFGRRMSDAAINRMSESRSALASLRDLRSVLQANEQYIGPLAGLQALNPYSEGRKAQADIDRVRQRVGRALEGGVLRKEDEEKYKKILATLRDEPTTAIYKVDQLIQDVERDMEIFIEEQRSAGRRVGTPAKPAGATMGGKVLKFDAKGNPIP